MGQKTKKFAPAIDKRLLIALSGITWSTVGIFLCKRSILWLSQTAGIGDIMLGAAGIILSLLIHHLGFLKIVNRNIERILLMERKVCIFAFQAWKSYLIVAIMIAMGIILRRSQIPTNYISVIYIGFGGAMILSSIRYYRIFFKLIFNPSKF
ncbi:MAG: hypothetical protein V3R54_00050 [Thermodesulfovibrionia bacterium]